jgi:hypothetical protein
MLRPLLLVLLAGGCPPADTGGSTTPRSEPGPLESGWQPPTDGVDYGKYPTDYEAIVKSWFDTKLKDPDSAKYKSISKPRKEHAIVNQFRKEAVYGYSVCATVNAKNSYGGYTGYTTQWFLIRDGSIVRTQDASMRIYIGHNTNCEDGVPPDGQTPSTEPGGADPAKE